MKKHILILIAAMMLGITAQAQDVTEIAYQKGDNLFNAGIGFGSYNYGFFGTRSSSFPALSASYEIGFHEYFGVGPYVGYKSWKYNYGGGNSYGFSLLSVGVRGSFHYSSLLNEALDMGINEEKLDLYVVLVLGLEFQTYTGDYGPYFNENSNTQFRAGPSLGARYYISPNFGIFVEGGRGAFSWLNLGVTLKM